MSSHTPRIIAALTLTLACVAVWALTRAPEPEATAEDAGVELGDDGDAIVGEGPIDEVSAPEVTRSHAPPTTTTSAAEPGGVREAPGPAPWARGLDLPAPEVPDVAPVPDPAHLRYREDSEDVAPETHVAYLENSLRMLDGTVGALEAELEERGETSSDAARALTTRIARLRQARTERVAELETMRARAGGATIESAPREGI